jgi:hypothetical protein
MAREEDVSSARDFVLDGQRHATELWKVNRIVGRLGLQGLSPRALGAEHAFDPYAPKKVIQAHLGRIQNRSYIPLAPLRSDRPPPFSGYVGFCSLFRSHPKLQAKIPHAARCEWQIGLPLHKKAAAARCDSQCMFIGLQA